MLSARDHAVRVSTAVESGEAVQSKLVASWSRCIRGYGLDPIKANPQRMLSAAELRDTTAEMEELLFSARSGLDRLHLLAEGIGACVLLAAGNGVPIHSSGRIADTPELQRWGLRTGVDWSEQIEGTNGIGTCLVEKSPLLIHKDQHFYARDIDISCAVAPVFDHTGEIAGALNVTLYGSATNGVWPSHMVSFVSDIARQIEIDHFHHMYRMTRIISLPGHPRSGGMLLAVDTDDVVVAANRGARLALKLTTRDLSEGVCARDLLEGVPDDISLAERGAIRRALLRSRGNVSAAANALSISRATMKRKVSQHRLNKKMKYLNT